MSEKQTLDIRKPELFSNFHDAMTGRQRLKKLMQPVKRFVKWLVRR